MAPMDTSGSGAVGGGASSDEHSTTAQLSPAAAASDTSAGDSHDPGKMFIGGLSWQTTAETLREYFSKFGELTECMVMRDPATRRARGFGFITFSDPTSVDKVLNNTVHELDGKKIDPKVAFPKRSQPKMVTRTKKIFVGGLSASSTVEDMKTYFEQYGKIEDAMLMFDKTTQRHRGFGFVTFESEDVVEKVTEIHFHEINGKMVECKKAQPKEVMLPVQMNKTRAAAARSLYGLAPDQLLAYSSLIPRYGGAGAFGAASPLYYHPAVLNGYKGGWPSAAGPTSPSAAAAALMGHSAFGAPGGAGGGGMSQQQLEAALYTAMCNGALTQAGSMPVELQAAMSQSFSAAATPASPQPGSYAAAALAAAAAAQHQHQAAQQHQASSQQPFAHPAAAQHMMKQQLNGQLITATYNGHGHY